MPDGTRKRRFSADAAKRAWYASYRARRFAIRFWGRIPPGVSADADCAPRT